MRVGETRVDLRKGDSDDLVGKLTADALRSGAGGALKAQLALQNAGGLRITEIRAGPVRYGQLFDLYPFDNEQVVVSLPASQLRNALEAVLHHGKGPMRVSALRYVIDWDKFGAGGNAKPPDGAIVVRMVDEAGKVLCETRSCKGDACDASCAPGTYTVAVTDFLSNGGDGLTMLEGAPKRYGGTAVRDILVTSVKAHQVPAADGRGANPARSMRALARSVPAIAASLAVVGLSRSVYVHFVAERPSDLLRPRQAFNEELRPLATLLPARGEVGYVTDEAIQSPGGEWQGPKQRFLQVQYAVAPVVLRYDEDRAPLVLVNATSEKSLNELVARRGLIVIARVTSGLAVARPK